MEDDYDFEEEELEEFDSFEEDPFDVWRDNHMDEWEKILGRKNEEDKNEKKGQLLQ